MTAAVAVPDRARVPAASPPPERGGGSLIGDYGILVASQVGAQLLGLIGLAIVSRWIGPSGLGDYAYAASVVAYFGLPLLPGLALLGTRRVTIADHADRSRIVFEIQVVAIAFAVLTWFGLVLLAPVLAPNPRAAELIPVVGLTIIINAAAIGWALQGLRRMRAIAVTVFVGQVGYVAVILALLAADDITVSGYAWANNVGFALTSLPTAWIVWRSVGRPSLRTAETRVFGEHRAVRRLLRAALPLATSAAMVQVYLYSAALLLGILATPEAVGQYTTASRLPIAALFLSTLWGTVFFPHAADLWRRDRTLLLAQTGRFATLAGIVFLPTVPVGLAVGGDALTAMFGEEFRPGGTTFALLFGFAALSMVNVNLSNLMLAGGDDRGLVIRAAVAAAGCIGFGFALIPIWGAEGAAAAAVLAEMLVLVLSITRVGKRLGRVPPPEPRRLLGVVVALGVTAIVLIVLGSLPWLALTVVAVSVYYATVLGTGAVRRSDLRTDA
jgi:O-antigen/teichoic acid export membrane protein